MPAYHVERSKRIDAPVEKVHVALADFRAWPKWSPWLIMEPEAKLTYRGTQGTPGASYEWDGDLVGAGGMKLVTVSAERLEMDLHFIRPFRSRAKVAFELEPGDGGCRVTWHMRGKLPFFLFFMTEKMKAWIGMDYDRGLTMLRDYVEKGSVPSQLSIDGRTRLDAQRYVGIEGACRLADLGTIMTADYEKLHGLATERQWKLESSCFAIYHSLDFITTQTRFISAIPVSGEVEVDPPFVTGELPAGDYFRVSHTGSYDHLGNAWSAAFNASRYRKVKTRKSPMGVERYVNDPAEVPSGELVTEILLPVKS